MPRIPAYQPRVQAQATPGGKISPNAPAGAFGEGLGQGLQQASNIAQQAIDEVYQTRYTDAMNKVFATDEELSSQAKALQGDQFLQVGPKKFLDDRTARVQEIVKDLPEYVKARVLQSAERSGISFKSNLDSHLSGAHEVVLNTNYETALNGVNTYSASHPTDQKGIDARLGLTLDAMEPLLKRMEQPARAEKIRSLMAEVLINQTTGLLNANNPTGAKEFFDKNAEAMSASVHFSKIKSMVTSSSDAQWVQDNAQGIAGSGMDLAQQLETVDTLAKDNPDQLKALRAEVTHRFNQNEAAQAKAQDETKGRLMDMRFPTLPGSKAVSLPGIMKSPEWASITPQMRRGLLESWESEEKERAGGGKVDEGTELARYGVYLDIMDRPVILRDMSDAQIIGRYGRLLGDSLTKKILDQKRTIEKEGDPKIDPDSFKEIARTNGLKVDSTKPNDKAIVGKLRDRAEEAIIEAEKAQGGKKLDRKAKEEIIRNLTRNVSLETYRSNWWNKKEEKRLFEIDNPAAIDASMVADPEKFQGLLDEFEKAGVFPTKERLRNAYLLKYSQEAK